MLAGVADDDYRRAVEGMEPPVTRLQNSSLNLTLKAVKAKKKGGPYYDPTIFGQRPAGTSSGAEPGVVVSRKLGPGDAADSPLDTCSSYQFVA